MQHEMRLAKQPFEKIRDGLKTIECRLFDDKRQQINPGDDILFRSSDDETQEVNVHVVALFRYGSFGALIADFSAALFGGNSTEDLLAELRRFYSEDEEKKHGVVGIKISALVGR